MNIKTRGNGRGDETGSAIIIAMMILIILTLIGLAATRMTLLEQQISTAESRYKDAFYKADSGVSYAMQFTRDRLEGYANCDELPVPADADFKLFLHRGPTPCTIDPDDPDRFKNPWTPDGKTNLIMEFRSESVAPEGEGKVTIFGEIELASENKGALGSAGDETEYQG